MALKPETSVAMGLATATVVGVIYAQALPSQADVRSLDSHNQDLAAAERAASWTAAGAVAAISLLTRDATVFILGGSMVIALSWWHRHSNAVSPLTGKVSGSGGTAMMVPATTQTEAPAAYSAPNPVSYDMVV